MIVAPSTAVSPAIASTARLRSSCHRGVGVASHAQVSQLRETADRPRTASGVTIDSSQRSVPDGTTSSAPPRPCCRIDAASCTSTVGRPGSGRRDPDPEQRGHHGPGSRGRPRRPLVDDLDLIAFEDRDVHELAERLGAVLDDDQSRGDDFDDEAERRNVATGAPHVELVAVAPHAKVNARDARPRAPPSTSTDGLQRQSGAQTSPRAGRHPAAGTPSRCVGACPSSRRRLAQKAASMMAAIASGEGLSTSPPSRARAAAM